MLFKTAILYLYDFTYKPYAISFTYYNKKTIIYIKTS